MNAVMINPRARIITDLPIIAKIRPATAKDILQKDGLYDKSFAAFRKGTGYPLNKRSANRFLKAANRPIIIINKKGVPFYVVHPEKEESHA